MTLPFERLKEIISFYLTEILNVIIKLFVSKNWKTTQPDIISA